MSRRAGRGVGDLIDEEVVDGVNRLARKQYRTGDREVLSRMPRDVKRARSSR